MIAEIPIDVMMNERTALKNEKLQKFFQSTYITATNEMALHLLFEKFLGESSFWFPYLRLLPSHFTTFFFFILFYFIFRLTILLSFFFKICNFNNNFNNNNNKSSNNKTNK